MITILVLGLFLLFFLLRVPVAASMIMVSLIVLVWGVDVPLVVIPQYMMAGLTKYELLAVPFFILAAEIMNVGGLTERLFRFAAVCTSWMRGGLAQVNIAASMIFAGISGTAVADAAGLGRIEIAAMKRAGYDVAASGAITLASCILGPLIPPSVVMVIYAILAEVSVGRMLLAGVGPGLLLSAALMTFIWWQARTGRMVCPPVALPTRAEFWSAIWGGLPAVVAPGVILFGIVGGVITTTEAGVAACIYSLLVARFVYRDLTPRRLLQAFVRATLSTAMIMFIIATATVMSFIVTREQAAQSLMAWMGGVSDQAWVQLFLINILLLIVGCLIEGIPAMLILIPIMLPAMAQLGVDPVHFGVILIFNLLIGIITPPMGVGLFIVASITGLKVEAIARACLPYFIPLLITLGLITYVPMITLWLPRTLMP